MSPDNNEKNVPNMLPGILVEETEDANEADVWGKMLKGTTEVAVSEGC